MSAQVGRSISWPLERARDRETENNNTIRSLWLYGSRDWIVLLLSTVCTGLAGRAITITAAWLATLREGHCSGTWYLSRALCCKGEGHLLQCGAWHNWPMAVQWLPYLVLSSASAWLSAWFVDTCAPLAALSGIPEIKTYAAGYEMPGLFTWQTLAVKCVGLCLLFASGLWLGIEAPMVHVAASFAALFIETLFPTISDSKRREIVMAAAATGISVAFGAPIGGLLFVLEVFSPPRIVVWQGFVCAMIGALIAGNPFGFQGIFRVGGDRIWHSVELVPFAIVGALGGVYGALTIRANAWLVGKFTPKLWMIAAAAFVGSAVSYATTLSRIPHSQLLSLLFAECRTGDESLLCSSPHVLELVYTFICGALLTPVMFGFRVPSGILLPSILVGALGGRLMGLLMRELLERLPGILSTQFCPDASDHCITPGVYAVAGAAAVLTGVSRLTIASVVTLFELTGALSFVVPIMVGVMVSKWVGDAFGVPSIYESWINISGLPSLGTVSSVYPELSASEFMETAVSTTQHGEELDLSGFRGVPVVDSNNKFIEYATKYGPEPVAVLSPQATLNLVVSTLNKLGVRVVIFCEQGEVRGLSTRKDVVRELRKVHSKKSFGNEYELEPLASTPF